MCLRLLAARPRSRHELATRLARRGAPVDAVEQVLDRLTEVELIDDAAFARTWVSNRHEFSGRGRRALSAELRGKGIDDELVRAAVAEVDDDAERERAVELVRRKLRTVPVPGTGDTADDEAARAPLARRLVGFLARRGYPLGVASEVVAGELDAHVQQA